MTVYSLLINKAAFGHPKAALLISKYSSLKPYRHQEKTIFLKSQKIFYYY